MISMCSAETSPMPTQEYFDEYGMLYDHVGMLQDDERMAAYYDAIRLNADRHFKGKVVLDVGAGTGILSIWAAQAGAKRVYAVEATAVAAHAKKLINANKLSETITILRGRMEDLELPEKVDVILSEWMGYFLLRESMVQSVRSTSKCIARSSPIEHSAMMPCRCSPAQVLLARDRWLAPGGVMYPSDAQLFVASLREPGFNAARAAEALRSADEWEELSERLLGNYNLDMRPLQGAYQAENEEYSWKGWQGAVPEHAAIGEPQTLLDVRFHGPSAGSGWRRPAVAGVGWWWLVVAGAAAAGAWSMAVAPAASMLTCAWTPVRRWTCTRCSRAISLVGSATSPCPRRR